MEHLYGITIDPSVKYKNKLEDIADIITRDSLAKKYFGRSPFITPDKNVFVLQSNPVAEDQLVIANNEMPQNTQINLTVRHSMDQKNSSQFDEITELTQFATKQVLQHLKVDVARIGSVHKFELKLDDARKFLLDHFVNNFIGGDDINFSGGYYKFLYRETPYGLPEMNINITLEASEYNDAIIVEVDVNNNRLGSVDWEKVKEIGNYSRTFIEGKLSKFFEDKGINIGE